MNNFTKSWRVQLLDILMRGLTVNPRGLTTKEMPHYTLADIDMRCPVLTVPSRKLNYKFMAAEAYWILTGDDRVSGIAPYNKEIAKFSDDGVTFFGAYGPKILGQLDYVVRCLHENLDTRQAGLTIWRENPPATKDLPCTVSIFFHLRYGKLNCHVFMRSSDVWLGIPYDVFNMSMLSHLVCGKLTELGALVEPGALWLTAASSHLYNNNWDQAWQCIEDTLLESNPTPTVLYQDPQVLLNWLKGLREVGPGDSLRWWE